MVTGKPPIDSYNATDIFNQHFLGFCYQYCSIFFHLKNQEFSRPTSQSLRGLSSGEKTCYIFFYNISLTDPVIFKTTKRMKISAITDNSLLTD